MRGYVPSRFTSPTIVDEEPAAQAIAAIIDRRTEIVGLARIKAMRITAKWYAMTRIMLGFEEAQDTILEHPLMRDVDIPESEIARALADMKP